MEEVVRGGGDVKLTRSGEGILETVAEPGSMAAWSLGVSGRAISALGGDSVACESMMSSMSDNEVMRRRWWKGGGTGMGSRRGCGTEARSTRV